MTSIQPAVSAWGNWSSAISPSLPRPTQTIPQSAQESKTDLYALGDETRKNSLIGGFGNNSIIDINRFDPNQVSEFAIAAEVAETEPEKPDDPNEITDENGDQGLFASLFGGFFPPVESANQRSLATA
jgi:hypothetical protein